MQQATKRAAVGTSKRLCNLDFSPQRKRVQTPVNLTQDLTPSCAHSRLYTLLEVVARSSAMIPLNKLPRHHQSRLTYLGSGAEIN